MGRRPLAAGGGACRRLRSNRGCVLRPGRDGGGTRRNGLRGALTDRPRGNPANGAGGGTRPHGRRGALRGKRCGRRGGPRWAALRIPGRGSALRSDRAGRGGRGPDGVWGSFDWDGRITALTFVDDAGTLVATTYSDGDDTTGLVRLDPVGRTSVVARMGASADHVDSDGRARALACDDPHGVVWVAGGFGLAAFAIR